MVMTWVMVSTKIFAMQMFPIIGFLITMTRMMNVFQIYLTVLMIVMEKELYRLTGMMMMEMN